MLPPKASAHPTVPAAGRLRRRARGEEGFTLVEVLVSALLVALVSIGVFAGLDSANATSATSRSQAVAAGLAQQDQDRLRALGATALSNRRETRTVSVSNGNGPALAYTVVSRGDWVSDNSDTASCTSTDSSLDYLHISSTVTWPKMRVNPVVADSIYAVPNGSFGANQGSLVVQVTDRNGDGVPNLPVSLSGPQSQSDSTNANGCVVWGYLPTGSYTVSFSRSGWVDHDGNQDISKAVSVIGESTNTVSFDYDAAGTINAGFYTVINNKNYLNQPTDRLSVGHGNLSSPFYRSFGTSGTLATSIQTVTTGVNASPGLFPFPSAYSVWAGDCAGEDPSKQGINSTGNTTSASKTISSVPAAAVTAMKVGMTVTGAGIAAGSTIASIPSGTSITLNNNATATATGVGLTVNSPGPSANTLLVQPGVLNQAVAGAPANGVRVPPLDLNVQSRTSSVGSYSNRNNAAVRIVPITSGCTNPSFIPYGSGVQSGYQITAADPVQSGAGGKYTAGRLPLPGLPYGYYKVCAYYPLSPASGATAAPAVGTSYMAVANPVILNTQAGVTMNLQIEQYGTKPASLAC